jgi:uncharacterized SAM-binding protein YcdF (DUF218 family)
MYRLVVDLLQPHVMLCLWVGWALVQLGRQSADPRRRVRWLVIPLLALLAISTPLASYLALGTLEWSYPPLERRPDDAQAIVVLSGDIRPWDETRKKADLGVDSLYRCLRAVDVYFEGSKLPLVVSGGSADTDGPTPPLAEVMRDFLLRLGVPAGDMLVEDQSRSTHENAVETSQLLEARGFRRIVLVTDAAHLPRAAACFRKQGIDVVPCGCRYRATRLPRSLEIVLPDPSAARGVREAWHEWCGIAWYWICGRL